MNVRRKSPPALFVLIFGLSLPFWVVGALVESPEGMPMGLPVSALMFVAPLVAAVILSAREHGRAGVGELLRRAVDHRKIESRAWLTVAVLLMPAVLLLSYGVLSLRGDALPPAAISWASVPVLLVLFLVAAAAEELGWMGYAVDPLRARWGATVAGVVIGAVWGLWHVVPWAQTHAPGWVAGQFLMTVALRVVMVRVYVNAGGSVLTSIVVHAMTNLGIALFPRDGSHFDPVVTGVIVTAVAVAVTLGAGTRWRGREASAGGASRPRSGVGEAPAGEVPQA
ncbi:type II CAAX endopeptidase family protein [Nonomuraea sp. NPDC003804]|uniref:CPBP family intramembrane glutamic endopeptidase n=1 Tax=Nonomuraea sp. NPDC003804 TaxID=3154547 RepID=UPI0033B054D3